MPQRYLTNMNADLRALEDTSSGQVADMIHTSTSRDARTLLREGWSDEEVERITGLSLDVIVGLRAEAASAPATAKPGRTFKAEIRAKAPGPPAGQVRSPPLSPTPGKPFAGRSPA